MMSGEQAHTQCNWQQQRIGESGGIRACACVKGSARRVVRRQCAHTCIGSFCGSAAGRRFSGLLWCSNSLSPGCPEFIPHLRGKYGMDSGDWWAPVVGVLLRGCVGCFCECVFCCAVLPICCLFLLVCVCCRLLVVSSRCEQEFILYNNNQPVVLSQPGTHIDHRLNQ